MNAKLIERFESKIFYSPDGCWYWTAFADRDGYGQMNIKGRTRYAAHRLSYAIYKGEIQTGKLVCHSCDNRLCVNPDHLWLGSHMDNVKDMITKNRQNYGKERKDFSNYISGRLIVTNFSHTENGKAYWRCKCDCGSIKNVWAYHLRKKSVQSCGCGKMGTKGGRYRDQPT